MSNERRKGFFKDIDDETLSKRFVLHDQYNQYIKNDLLSLLKEEEYKIYPQYTTDATFDILIVIPDRIFTKQPDLEIPVNIYMQIKMIGIHCFITIKIWNDGPTSDIKNVATIMFCPIDYLWFDKTREKIHQMVSTKFVRNPALIDEQMSQVIIERIGMEDYKKKLMAQNVMVMSESSKNAIYGKDNQYCIKTHLNLQETIEIMTDKKNQLWCQSAILSDLDFRPLILWAFALDEFYELCNRKMSQIWVDNVKIDECERCQFIAKTYKFPKIIPKYAMDRMDDILKGGDYLQRLLKYKESLDVNKFK